MGFIRDDDGTVLGFEDDVKAESMEVEGRFTKVWTLEQWMGPHYAVNLPLVLKGFGRHGDEKALAIARIGQEMVPPDYPVVRLRSEDIEAVVSSLKMRRDVEQD